MFPLYSLVGADTSRLQRFRAQLLILVRDHVHAAWELIDVGTLAAEIEDADLGVWHTTVEARLGVRLVLAVAVAPSWTSGHCVGGVCCGSLVVVSVGEESKEKVK